MTEFEAAFRLNAQASSKFSRVGTEGEPVVVIDDVFLDPERVVEFASVAGTFGPGGRGYPGLRAPVPEPVNQALFIALQPILGGVFQIGQHDSMTMTSCFSMITQQPGQLATAQLLPHFDTPVAKAIAILIYLCDPSWGGTDLYRHRSTGFETISPERAMVYNQGLAEELSCVDLPQRFPDERHPLFERFHQIEPKFNRMVLYRSRLLHSASVTSQMPLCEDPARGRLTITSFLKPA